jgi:two-component system OmpR family sensor kinase
MWRRLNYSGLVIAGIGFFGTRFTVALTTYEQPIRFALVGVLPLALGLGLAAFGVALTVADVESWFVRTTALWCAIGTGVIVLLVGLTLLGSNPERLSEAVQSRTAFSNVILGGSVGGTLTGLYAARNRHQQGALRQQADRLEVLNRLLRDEVLNAVR